METKIFGRLSAWQNWIFQPPQRDRAEGALQPLRHRLPARPTTESGCEQ